MEPHEYIIYDGLGLLVDTLKPESIQTCSTFRCIIHLVTQLTFRHGQKFIFYSNPLSLTESMKIIENQTIVLNLPNTMCSDKICVLKFKLITGIELMLL